MATTLDIPTEKVVANMLATEKSVLALPVLM